MDEDNGNSFGGDTFSGGSGGYGGGQFGSAGGGNSIEGMGSSSGVAGNDSMSFGGYGASSGLTVSATAGIMAGNIAMAAFGPEAFGPGFLAGVLAANPGMVAAAFEQMANTAAYTGGIAIYEASSNPVGTPGVDPAAGALDAMQMWPSPG